MKPLHGQAGFSLLLYVLMIMAMGGFLLEGYLQNARSEAESQKRKFDREVLMKAKTALLQYAYNYPVLGGNGPGRLPCSDTDNDGQSNTLFGSCDDIGRFPFAEPLLNTPELRDSSGERLWYVPATTYMTQFGGAINVDTVGTITVKDQSGQVLYDGAVNGVAAVIIAPGAAIDRNGTQQDRSVSNGDDPNDFAPDTDPGIIDPVNYLDLNGGQDNATLTHLDSDDGFQLGPVENANNELVINDQVVFITTDEINRMAQKAVLQTYEQALRNYQKSIWGTVTADYRFPWLDSYSTTNLAEHDADVGTNWGRMPSLFAPYYDPSISAETEVINTNLTVSISYNGFDTPDIVVAPTAAVKFDADADLHVTPSATDSSTLVRYFWDEEISPDGWELCPPVTGTVQDCNQSAANPGVPDASLPANQVAIRVIEVSFTRNLTAGNEFQRLFSSRSIRPPRYEPPDNSRNAVILAEFIDNTSGDELDVDFVYDNYYLASFDNVASGSLNQYQLGIDFYPVLPDWLLPAQDDWHDTILMVYSSGYQPGTASPASCIPNNGDGVDDSAECLLLNGLSGIDNDKAAVLVESGELDLVDEAADGYQNDLADIFEGENAAVPPLTVLDWRARPAPGNQPDILLMVEPN